MIVECINNDQANAPKVFENHYVHPEYLDNTLTVGASYFVYGMHIWHDDLRYLVRNDSGYARWKSPYFFRVSDSRLPSHWEFKYNVIEGAEFLQRVGVRAVWGYPALVNRPGHNDNLLASDDAEPGVAEDLKLFQQEVDRRVELGY